jgi:AraC family transcriptional regulator
VTPIATASWRASVTEYPPGATYGPRVIDDYEFVWLLSGSAIWDCDGVRLELAPGTLLLIRPGMRDLFTWDQGQSTRHAYIHFSVTSADQLRADAPWPVTRTLGIEDPMAALCRYLLWLSLSASEPSLERTSEVVGWLLQLFVAGPLPSDDVSSQLDEHIERLIRFVRTTWRSGPGEIRAISLAELSAAAAVSSGHLSRLFRKQFTVGPVGAMELIRLGRAAILLQRSNMSVAAISESCGFVNPYHFSRRFSHAYGLSPRAFRATTLAPDPLAPLLGSNLLPVAQRLLFDDM